MLSLSVLLAQVPLQSPSSSATGSASGVGSKGGLATSGGVPVAGSMEMTIILLAAAAAFLVVGFLLNSRLAKS